MSLSIRPLLLSAIILPAAMSTSLAASPELAEVQTILATHTLGQDPTLSKIVAPALSLDARKTQVERATQINQRLNAEFAQVVEAFTNAADGDKVRATRQMVSGIDQQTGRDGASRTFEGSGPALSVARQILFVPTSALTGADPAAQLTSIISSFERSPKPEDEYYEYSDAALLSSGSIKTTKGSANSYLDRAQPAMNPGEAYALKKCRYIFFSWYCNTQLYSTFKLTTAIEPAWVMTSDLYDLTRNADNRFFNGGGRVTNTAEGSTSLYFVKASGSHVLVYFLVIQSTPGTPRFQDRLNEGHKLEFRQLAERIRKELRLATLP